MFNQQLLMKLIAVFSMALFFLSSALAQTLEPGEAQQEESFSEPVRELTGRPGDVPVYSHIYGADFMTEQERCNYLLKLDGMKSKKERDAYRAKHREKIEKKRKEKGG
jgi:hypothetical protein